MAYNTATVVEGIQEADGRIRLMIAYTGNAAEPPVMLPLYINQAQAPGSGYIRGQAMNQIAVLNTNRTLMTSFTLPLVLDTTTPLPTPGASPVLQTYMAASAPFTPGATPQDVFTIAGSATKTISIIRTGICTTQTTGGINTWHLVKRSTANTVGTPAALPAIPTSTGFGAASATVLQYTANPTAGTLVGRIWAGRVTSPAVGTVGVGDSEKSITISDRSLVQPITLSGIGEVLAWNFNGVALPVGLSVTAYVWWTEV